MDIPKGHGNTLRRVARAITPDGDAAHTDFTVVCRNPDACLTEFACGLVATEPMYKDRSFRMSCCLAWCTALSAAGCLAFILYIFPATSSLICSMQPYAHCASTMA